MRAAMKPTLGSFDVTVDSVTNPATYILLYKSCLAIGSQDYSSLS